MNNVSYENIAVDLGEKFHSQQIQHHDGEQYLWKTDCPPRLLVIDCDRLGKNAGNQRCEEADDLSGFDICYTDIRASGIRCVGGGGKLASVVSSRFAQHRICGVTLNNVDTSECRITGNVQHFSLNNQ